MSYRKKLSTKMSDDETISEKDYLTSVLSVVNGYCKIDLVVPQISSFYKSDSLLPINAKVDDTILNNTIHKSQINMATDSLVHILQNSIQLKDEQDNEILDDKQFQLSDKTSVDDFQVYSKPSYSDNSNIMEKKEDKKRAVSPKGKKKKNKYNKLDLLDSLNIVPSTSLDTDPSTSKDYMNQYKNERLDDGGFISVQEQMLRKKQIKNNINVSRSQASMSTKKLENDIENDNLTNKSQCPLCFQLYPTPDIEAHASECSI